MSRKQVQNISYDEEYVTLEFKGTAREANVLRHAFLSKIPTMAIDKVNIRRNTTTQSDEYLTERLQLTPIMVDAGELKDTTTFTLTVDQAGGVLRSQDIKGKCKAENDIIIVRMNDCHRFTADMICRKSTAEEHPRWSAVANVGFKELGKNLFQIRAHSVGIYTPQRLLELALEAM
uniref:DNA-directed RNA polymerase RpoA/D/Rpb3-type domain-containing protein n=1 Tax=viral metagenome TaxID=1070528 RepID=A0A6C0EKD5_9ZZZZ